ncbi:MAG: acyl-CoA dehydrogenase family protein [Acidimicrobiia bacterium]
MRFDLSEDVEFFRATASRFIADEMPVTATRALESDADGFDRDTWRRAAELGWTSLLAPASLGGGGLSANAVADLAVVAEEMGRRVAPGPLLPVNVVVDALARSGQPALVDDVAPGLMAGDTIAAWALAESRDVWGIDGLGETVVLEDGDDFVVSGHKRFVEAAASADVILVSAMSAGGPAQVLVDASAAGLAVVPGRSVDLVRRFADLHLDGVRVPARAVVGQLGGAADDIEHQCQLALALQVAETVGGLDHVYAMTLEYLEDRWSFGRPLASYQALKHRLADMLLMLETAKGCADAAADAVGTASASARRDVSVAKAYVASAAIEILGECVQLHGGIAMTWEHDLHLYERRAAVNRAVYGSPEHHEELLCALVETGAV